MPVSGTVYFRCFRVVFELTDPAIIANLGEDLSGDVIRVRLLSSSERGFRLEKSAGRRGARQSKLHETESREYLCKPAGYNNQIQMLKVYFVSMDTTVNCSDPMIVSTS